MKTRNLRVLFLTILAFLCTPSLAEPVLGCSMVQMPEPPRSSVHRGMFILVGEVIGYTEAVTDPNNFRGSATGYKLKIIEPIQIPSYTSDYVELFTFTHGSDCSPEASTWKAPLGARFRVALAPATLVGSSSNSHVRLESKVFSRIGSDESFLGFSTTAGGVFDYKKDLPILAEKVAPFEMAEKRRWLDDFLYIEASKDLIRLHKATTEKDRMDILERLLYCPNIAYFDLLHSKIGSLTEMLDFPRPHSVITWENRFVFGKRKLTKKEQQLFSERMRLENSGELKYWKNWKNSAN